MRYFIGKPIDAFKEQKTYTELSRALHQTNSAPHYDDHVIFIYDDEGNLKDTKIPGDQIFLDTKVWFYKELHKLQNTYGDWHSNRAFPALEQQLRQRLIPNE